MPMYASIDKMTNGWFIGDFEPSILQTKEFEVAHHFYAKGFKGTPHTHKVATEYNYVVRGKARVSGLIVEPGDIFIYLPGEVSDVEFLEDTDLIIVKTPSLPEDKYDV